jgi:hypothetical protein
MGLDNLLQGVESQLSRQSELMALAEAWVQKTDGRVTSEVTFDAQDYVSMLTSIPLWEEVKDDLKEYIPVLTSSCIRRGNKRGTLARMLLYFPTVITVVNHVIDNDFYSAGQVHTPLAQPFEFSQILRNYVASGTGDMVRSRGDGRKALMAITNEFLNEDTVFQTTGITEKWAEYQSKKKLPPFVADKLQRTLRHFLDHEHYSAGSGRHGALGQPLPLRAVVRNYKAEGRGAFTKSKGDCSQVYIALFKDMITEDMIWEATGMGEEWEKYQNSTKLPPEMKDKIEHTLRTFLENPLYSRGCAAYGPEGNPLPIMSIFRSYISEEGRIQKKRGDLHQVWDGLIRDRISLDMVWSEVPLREQWQAYERTTASKPYVFQLEGSD